MLKIAIPKDEIYNNLTANAEEVCKKENIMLISDTEARVGELFQRNSVDLALVSTYDLILHHRKGDFRIIPATSLSISGRTGHFHVHIKKDTQTLKTVLLMIDSPYLTELIKILYLERYNIEIDITTKIPKDGNIADFDIVINHDECKDCEIDLSEDWYDTFKNMIPLAFWVGRNEEIPHNAVNLINSFAASSLPEKLELPITNEEMTLHQGIIYNKWSAEQKEAIEFVSDLLYYRGKVSDIADIKILEV